MRTAKAHHETYGRVRVLDYTPTNRGGLVQIQVYLPCVKDEFDRTVFKRGTNTFWVRAGEVLPA